MGFHRGKSRVQQRQENIFLDVPYPHASSHNRIATTIAEAGWQGQSLNDVEDSC